MTDREKLIELLNDGRGCPDDMAPFGDEVCSQCRYEQDLDCDIARLADYLISHGVTAQEWIPVTELPDVGVKVLTLDKWGHVRDRELYQFSDGLMLFRPDGMLPGKDITHWRPMLQGPTEEK